MKRLTTILALATLVMFLGIGTALATPFNDNRPFSPLGQWVGPPSEPTLQTVLDDTFGIGVIDAVNDQSNAAIWIPAEAPTDVFLVRILTSVSGELYIYSYATNAAYSLSLGGANIGDSTGFKFDTSGGLYLGNTLVDPAFGTMFGFYWKSNGTYYTEDDKNAGGFGPDQNIRALTYIIPDGSAATIGAFEYPFLDNNDWVIGFEDGSDYDFQDAVFAVEDMNPVPIPGTLVLLGSGLLGLAGLRRKFSKK